MVSLSFYDFKEHSMRRMYLITATLLITGSLYAQEPELILRTNPTIGRDILDPVTTDSDSVYVIHNNTVVHADSTTTEPIPIFLRNDVMPDGEIFGFFNSTDPILPLYYSDKAIIWGQDRVALIDSTGDVINFLSTDTIDELSSIIQPFGFSYQDADSSKGFTTLDRNVLGLIGPEGVYGEVDDDLTFNADGSLSPTAFTAPPYKIPTPGNLDNTSTIAPDTFLLYISRPADLDDGETPGFYSFNISFSYELGLQTGIVSVSDPVNISSTEIDASGQDITNNVKTAIVYELEPTSEFKELLTMAAELDNFADAYGYLFPGDIGLDSVSIIPEVFDRIDINGSGTLEQTEINQMIEWMKRGDIRGDLDSNERTNELDLLTLVSYFRYDQGIRQTPQFSIDLALFAVIASSEQEIPGAQDLEQFS